MSYIKGSRHAVTAIAVMCLLAACSGEQPTAATSTDQQVASLSSEGPKAGPAGDADDQRPLIPVDATDEDREALYKVWSDCVRREGGPRYENPKEVYVKDDATSRAVRKACLREEPETYEERQKRTDVSAFEDNQRQWYKCAEKEGYKLTAPQDNYQFGITEVGPNGDFSSPGMEACRRAAFAD